MHIDTKKQTDVLLMAFLFLAIFLINLPLGNEKFKIGDGALYLNIGINLFSGRGVVASYNIDQYWLGSYHPVFPYLQPIYPIVSGFLYFLFNGIHAIIIFNLLLFCINCVLLYKIIRLYFHFLVGFLIVLFIGFSKISLFTALFPWNEQLYLLSLLLTIFAYLKYEKCSTVVGLLLAVSCLIRAPGFLNVFCFGITLIVLKGFSKESLKEYVRIAKGFLILFLPYEIFCFLKYGVFYPEFYVASEGIASAGRTFVASMRLPGAFYTNSFPVLHMPLEVEKNVNISTYEHFIQFFHAFGNLKFLFLFTPFYFILNVCKKKNPIITIFFLQGAGYALCYSLVGTAIEKNPFGITRHAAFSFVFLSSVLFIAIYDLLNIITASSLKKWSYYIFAGVIGTFFVLELKDYLPFRNDYVHVRPQQFAPHSAMRKEMDLWIKENLEEDILIAGDFLYEPFFLERPFVSLPQGYARTVKNVMDFLKIYKPGYILTPDPNLIKFVQKFGFIIKKQAGYIYLLESTYNKEKLDQILSPQNLLPPKKKPNPSKPQGNW